MLTRHSAQLFGIGCLLLTTFEVALSLSKPGSNEIDSAKEFEKNSRMILGNERYYFLVETPAAEFRRLSFSNARWAAEAFKKCYTREKEFLPWDVTAPMLKDIRIAVVKPLIEAFKYLSEFANAIITPFGKTPCNLLPDAVSKHALVPQLGHTFETLAGKLTQTLTNVNENNADFSTSWGLVAVLSIRSVCGRFDDIDSILGTADELIDCYKGNGSDSTADFRRAMGTYAQLNGFPQGKSHTCLPSFIVEYTEHSAKAIAKLKNAVDKYAFLAFTVNGFCAELASRSSQASKMFRKSVEIVGSLKTGMSALDSVAPSTASPWDCQPLTSSTYSTASVTSTSEATAVSVSTNWWPSGAHDLARKTVDHVTSTVNAKTWEERKGHNNATAENVQRKLDNAFNATGYSFDALVYLPFTDARMHCLKNGSDSFYEYNRGNTNYFIKRYTNNPVKDLKIASKWNTVKGRQTTILNSVFSTATDDLCKRLREIEKDLLGGGDFSSIAAVRCGYKFVWYQLGYRYFPAAGTTSKHVISSSPKNEYSPNCGQIIFFR